MKDRIKKIIKDESISFSRFADEIGVQRSSVSHILTGRNNPSLEFVQKVLNRFRNINIEWLILGKGEMYKTDKNRQEIITEEQEAAVGSQQSAVGSQQSAVGSQQSAVGSRQSAVGSRQSVIGNQLNETSASQLNTSSAKDNETMSNTQILTTKKQSNIVEKVILLFNDSTFREYVPDLS